MTSDLHEFHDELRSVARELLSAGGQWQQFVDAGWVGLEIPDSAGGAGASFVETAILLQEIGRAAADTRYLGSALAVGALTASTPTDSRDALLERIGRGSTSTLATGFTVSRGVVSGHAEFVPDAHGAEVVLLLADDAGSPVVVLAPDVTITEQPVLDETRSLSVVAADGATIDGSWPLATDPGMVAARAAVAVACDSLGLCEGMLAATVEYATVRQQFGRPIGSFQAVKHACADMLVTVSVARQLIGTAVEALARDGEDREAVQVAAAMAKSYACAAAVDVVGKAMQLHGGIGYTWESGVHVYLKRALLNRALYGSPAFHRRRLAARYG